MGNKKKQHFKRTRKALYHVLDLSAGKEFREAYADISLENRALTKMLFLMKAPAGTPIPEKQALSARKSGDLLGQVFGAYFQNVKTKKGTLGGQTGEFYKLSKDPEKKKDSFFLYIHGGGFATGSVASRRYIAQALARVAHMDAFSTEYTQWPDGQFPEGLNECVKVYEAILDKGYAPENIVIAGESGGAVLCTQLCKYLNEHDQPVPGKMILLSPLLDLANDPPFLAERQKIEPEDPMLNAGIGIEYYFRPEDLSDDYIRLWKTDFSKFPETMITAGTREVLYEDAVRMHELLDKAGVPNTFKVYEKMFHAFQMFDTPETDQSLADIDRFLNA